MKVAGEHTYSVAESSTEYIGAILALRVDEVSMPAGRTARREVIEHYGGVAIVALNDSGEIALVTQYRHPLRRRSCELPAGLLDGGATETPVQAARRELVEEVGARANSWHTVIDGASSPGFTDESVRVFLARGISLTPRPPTTDEEADMVVEWVPLADAVDRVFARHIVNTISIAGILAADRALREGITLAEATVPWPTRPQSFARRVDS